MVGLATAELDREVQQWLWQELVLARTGPRISAEEQALETMYSGWHCLKLMWHDEGESGSGRENPPHVPARDVHEQGELLGKLMLQCGEVAEHPGQTVT